MTELLGFQTMVILDPNGMTIYAVGVFALVFWLLFKSGSSYCDSTCYFAQMACKPVKNSSSKLTTDAKSLLSSYIYSAYSYKGSILRGVWCNYMSQKTQYGNKVTT